MTQKSNPVFRRAWSAFMTALLQQRFKAETSLIETETQRFLGTLDDLPRKAIERMQVGKAFFTSETYLRQYDRADWQHCDPIHAEFTARFIEACRTKYSIPLFCVECFRTPERQEELRKLGRSNLQFGPHMYGFATDIIHSKFGWELTQSEWIMLGRIGFQVAQNMGYSVQWGGDWDGDNVAVPHDKNESFWDPAHWQTDGWRHYSHRKGLPKKGTPHRLTPRKILRDRGFA